MPWRRLIVGLVLATLGAPVGCRTTDVAPRSEPEPEPVPVSDETWLELRAAQVARLERLARLTARGSVLIDVEDESGERRAERAEHRFWREAPERAAVRLSKAGIGLSMTAWNGNRWWVMDESGDDVVLEVHALDAEGDHTLLAPPLLVAMAGLSDFPETPPADLVRIGESYRFTIPEPVLDGRSPRATLEITVADPRDGPTRIVRRSTGLATIRSVLTRFDSVEGRGRPPGDWASMPGRIEVVRGDDRLVITLDRPLAGGEMSPRLFDLDAQIERSNPSIVRGLR